VKQVKTTERFMLKVESVHPRQGMIVGATDDQPRVFVKGEFPYIFPSDDLLICGSVENNKKYGTHFQMDYYMEKKTENWVVKRLKYEFQVDEEQIMDYILYPQKRSFYQRFLKDRKSIQAYFKKRYFPKQYELYQQCLKEAKSLQMLVKEMRLKGIDEAVVAQMEYDYLWQYRTLLEDGFQLLRYPSIKVDWVEEWIKKGVIGEKKETKAYFYAQQILHHAYKQGHYYLPTREVEQRLSLKDLSVLDITDFNNFKKEQGTFYLAPYYEEEMSIARHIQQRMTQACPDKFDENIITDWEETNQFTLAKNQKEAVWMALNESFCVVTGGPGVGKTTVCKCITDILGDRYSIKIVAPTGRAAKRAQESTGLEASTVHSLLEYDGHTFHRNAKHPIDSRVLVIDESSMMDTPLLQALLDATPPETKIIFVGDVDQLPSVGAGQVLRDLIESEVVPVTRLTEIFRQAAGSPIIQCAYAVNSGNVPDLISHDLLEYHEHDDEDFLLKHVLDISTALYKEHSLFDVQVLIPMYDGAVGIHRVNRYIQSKLNKDKKGISVGDYELREGDKVIQTKNDKSKRVYNGDVGVVTSVSAHRLTVRFQGHEHETEYKPHEFWHLQLAYAVTVHRAQGSEYLYVVIPIVTSYQHMLQKNLFYTAITRAKQKLWILYEREAMERTVQLESVPHRYTGLATKLKTCIASSE